MNSEPGRPVPASLPGPGKQGRDTMTLRRVSLWSHRATSTGEWRSS